MVAEEMLMKINNEIEASFIFNSVEYNNFTGS